MSHEKKYFIVNFLHVIHKMYHISPNFTLQCYLSGNLHCPHISSAPGSSLSFRNKPVGVGQESVVGIATDWELDSLGIESRWRRNFPRPSRPALGPTQPPTTGTGSLSLG